MISNFKQLNILTIKWLTYTSLHHKKCINFWKFYFNVKFMFCQVKMLWLYLVSRWKIGQLNLVTLGCKALFWNVLELTLRIVLSFETDIVKIKWWFFLAVWKEINIFLLSKLTPYWIPSRPITLFELLMLFQRYVFFC